MKPTLRKPQWPSSTAAHSSPPYDEAPSGVVDMHDRTLHLHSPPPRHTSGGQGSSQDHATTSSASQKRKRSVAKTTRTRSTFVGVAVLERRQVSNKKTTTPHQFKKRRVAGQEPGLVQVARKIAPTTAKIPPAFETSRLKGLSGVGLGVNRSLDGAADGPQAVGTAGRAQRGRLSLIPDELEAQLNLLSTAGNMEFLDNEVSGAGRRASSQKAKSSANARTGPHGQSLEQYKLPRTRNSINASQAAMSGAPHEPVISQEIQSQYSGEEFRAGIEESSPSPAEQPASPGSPQSSSPGRSPSPLLGDEGSVEPGREHPNTIPETAEDQLQMLAGEVEQEDEIGEDVLEEENIGQFEDDDDVRLPEGEHGEEEVDEGRSQSAAEDEKSINEERVSSVEEDQDQNGHDDQDQEEDQELEEEAEQAAPKRMKGKTPTEEAASEPGQDDSGDPDYSASVSSEESDKAASEHESAAAHDASNRDSEAEEEQNLSTARDPALLAQEARIQAIVEKAEENLAREILLSASAIRKLVKTATEATSACRRNIEVIDEDNKEDQEELGDRLGQVAVVIERLRSKGLKGRRAIVELYGHGIPQLVKLLDVLFQYCTLLDLPNFPGLDCLISLAQLILQCYKLASDADSNKAAPSKQTAGYAVVRPVKNGIIPGLRKFYGELKKTRLQREQAIVEERKKKRRKQSNQKLDEQVQRERREHEEKVRERNRLIAQQTRERSQALFGSRQSEPRREGQTKQEIVSEAVDYPQLPRSRSSAGDGAFKANIPSPPADHQANTQGGIGAAQEEALVEGLYEFRGETRYVDILRKYGQPGQPLQSWDLDEIFKRAKEFKQNYLDNYEAKPSSKAPAPWLMSV